MTAKIQALLRRTYDMEGKIPILEHKGAVLNLKDMTLSYCGKRMELTKNEFRILQVLLENKGKVVSREDVYKRQDQSALGQLFRTGTGIEPSFSAETVFALF